ncbi:TlpA family protein disulfide reductase [Marinilabiliaceae bacterium JC017]|nr:TlpA family protein disulfide reductase [Marinilabiliaceae bacterium JC017]
MKQTPYLFLLIVQIMIIGCSKPTEEQTITIAGVVGDNSVSTAQIYCQDTIFTDTITNGTFHFQLKSINEGYLNLKLSQRIPLFVKNNDSLFLKITGTKSEIEFSGTGFEESQYIQQKNQLAKELGINDPRKIDKALFSSPPDVFNDKIDSIKNVRLTFLEQYKQENPLLNKSFVQHEQKLIDYYWMNQKFNYPGFHRMLTHQKTDLPAGYYSFVNRIETNDSVLFKFREYKTTMNALLNYKLKNLKNDNSTDLQPKYELAKSLFESEKIFETMAFNLIRKHIIFKGIENIDDVYNDYLNRVKNKKYKEVLITNYSKWEALKKGNQAPPFAIEDMDGKTVKLSDYHGKIVYLDCWSTYCGPCIEEIPALKKLSDEINDPGIVFVTISVDSDKNRWKTKLKEYHLNTVNLCTGGTRHKFNMDYNAKAFPRYILIDKDGTIINAAADKPSKIKDQLEKIIKQNQL